MESLIACSECRPGRSYPRLRTYRVMFTMEPYGKLVFIAYYLATSIEVLREYFLQRGAETLNIKGA